jgi:hypothetical protein
MYVCVCVCVYILMKESVFMLAFFEITAAWYVNVCPMRAYRVPNVCLTCA